jgi:hypothetical protein
VLVLTEGALTTAPHAFVLLAGPLAKSAPTTAPGPIAARSNCSPTAPKGCTEALMMARGFTVEVMAD